MTNESRRKAELSHKVAECWGRYGKFALNSIESDNDGKMRKYCPFITYDFSNPPACNFAEGDVRVYIKGKFKVKYRCHRGKYGSGT